MTGEQSVPEQIRDTIEASDYPELTVREVTDRTGLTEQQVYSAAGSMDRLELDRRVDVVRLPEDDGGEFVDDPEHELVTDGGRVEEGGPFERISRASAPAMHRLRDYRVMGWSPEVVDDVIDYCISRPQHRKGIGPETARELLKLGDGEFTLRLDGDSTTKLVRFLDVDDFVVKTVWTDAWPDCREDGEVEWEIKERDSVGHHLDHAICAFQDKTVLLTENHFPEVPEEVTARVE